MESIRIPMFKTLFHNVSLISFTILMILKQQPEIEALKITGSKSVPAVFVFGDSTVDVGTNNYIEECTAKANFRYNGVDYAHSTPTGRFSNGFNTADEIVKLLGFEMSPPPFLAFYNQTSSTLNWNLKCGLNFASGGSGILDTTGLQFHRVIPLREQIQQFSRVCNNITKLMNNNPNETAILLSKSLFLVSVGSNDIFEYNRTIPPQSYLSYILNSYQNHLESLYDLGARKFGILSVAPIGSIPAVRANCSHDKSGLCTSIANEFAAGFYDGASTLLKELSSNHKDIKYALADIYNMTLALINDPQAFGFKDVETACCGKGYLGADSPCNQTANLCPNRPQYLFWDMFHPTQTASELAAAIVCNGDTHFIKPINFSQLVKT